MPTKFFARYGMQPEFIRFLLVGSINTVSTYIIYLLALWISTSAILAYNISYMLGIGISYCLNLKITFKKKHSLIKMLSFPLVYVVQYVVGLIALKFFLSWGINAELAGLFIIPIIVPITFIFSRFILQ